MVGPARPNDDSRVIWAVAEGERSIRLDTDPLEASAALDGALHGLALVESLGAPVTGQVVRITSVVINVADTEPSAVRAAATAAVARAFGLEDECQLTYEHGWRYEPKAMLLRGGTTPVGYSPGTPVPPLPRASPQPAARGGNLLNWAVRQGHSGGGEGTCT